MASNEAIASIKHITGMMRYARKGSINAWSRAGRDELRRLLDSGEISHAELCRATALFNNACANRIVDCLPVRFRRRESAPVRVSA